MSVSYTKGLTIPFLTASVFGGMSRSLWRISDRVNLVSGDGLLACRVLVLSQCGSHRRRQHRYDPPAFQAAVGACEGVEVVFFHGFSLHDGE